VSRSVAERGIRVLVQEVPQRRDQLPSMRSIVLPNGRSYLIHQHVTDLFASALALEQIIAKHSRRGLGDMLVLGHDLDLLRREITEVDQILKGDHERLRYHRRITQFYLIFCGLQSQACGTAACFVTFLLALQALVWRPIHATVRAGASKCLAIQDRLPIYGARTSMASVRPLREKVDALYLNHIPQSSPARKVGV
jgi:hypothetical protein